ncbi:MAG: phosphonate ABC transporter, permease protein PhnE [Rhizobiales bacterium]|nr:phosphonate ABC transporter, permease protein PhnE [Hyphomicrobiales bacterium]
MTTGTLEDPVLLFERHRAELVRSRRGQTILLAGLFLLFLIFSISVSQFFPGRLADGLPKIGDYLQDILPTLDASKLLLDVKTEGSLAYWYFNLPKYLLLLFQTINMAVFATMVGALIGFGLSFPASRNLVSSYWIYFIARRIMEIARGVPDVIYAILFVWAFGIGPMAGIVAIAIHSAGALGKMFAEVNENVSERPIEGVRAVGGTWFEEMRFGVVPQVWPNFLSYIWLRLEINIRSSSIIGFVGGGGIGQELYYVINFNFYEEVSAIVLLVILTVTCVDLISERLRHRAIGREQLL